MNWRLSLVVCVSIITLSVARAQVTLPGAAPASPEGTPAAAPKPAPKAKKGGEAKAAKAAKKESPGAPAAAPIDGRPLMLNGKAGLLQLSGSGPALQLDRLRLAGESLSDPSQPCAVDIISEKPIEAKSEGRPDGLDRYDVDVPACPFAFDVLDEAVIVPSQITACVFKAADCQTSPGGLWGPDGDSLEKDAEAIGKRRNEAEKAMAKALRAIQERVADNPEAANLLKDQNGFPGQRDDACREYAKETALGFCAASLTEAHTALLDARLAALATPAGTSEKPVTPVKKKKKPKAETAAEPAQ
jgi:hypothetical protein